MGNIVFQLLRTYNLINFSEADHSTFVAYQGGIMFQEIYIYTAEPCFHN